MRKWMVPVMTVSGLALLAACGETSEQRTGTGAAGGAVAGAVVGGPVGAVVGAGVGAVAGANRDKVDEGTDKAADATKEKVAEASDKVESKMHHTHATNADRAGLSSEQVKQAQTKLKDIGLYDGPIDGIYGRKTTKAVSDFQAKNDLPKTGALNRQTQAKLQQQASAGDVSRPQDSTQGLQSPQKTQ